MKSNSYAVCLAFALLVGVVPAAQAQTEASIRFGAMWWDQDAREAKFQEFREVPMGGFIEDFIIRTASERNVVTFFGVKSLHEDQSTALRWNNGVRWSAKVSYSEIPHRFSYLARSPFTQTDPGVFIISDSLQRQNQDNPSAYVATMTDVLAASSRVPLEFGTDVSTARLQTRASRNWHFQLQGTRRSKSGAKAYGLPFGFNSAIELAAPIEQRMLDADAIAEYQHPRLTVQGDLGVSAFKNHVDRIYLDNPKRLTDRTSASAYTNGDGSRAGQLDLAPDNQSLRGRLGLSVALPVQSVFNANVAVIRNEQNDAWLPMTVNSAISQSSLDSLPGTNTDAKSTIIAQDYRVTTRPWRALTGVVRLHHQDYDNETPRHTFTGQVRMDQSFIAGRLTNKPFGNSELLAGTDLDWEVLPQATVGATYEFRRRHHTFREIESDEENRVEGRLRLRPVREITLGADYRHGERKSDTFILEDYENSSGVLIEQPGLRRYDVADRIQDRIRTNAGWTPNQKVSMGVSFEWLQNDFDQSELGLQEQQRKITAGNVLVTLTDRLNVNVGGGYEHTSATQKSRESAAVIVQSDTTSWTANPNDHNSYVFTSAEWWAAPAKLSFEVSYLFSRARATYDLLNFGGTAQDLPDTKHDLHDLLLEACYRVTHSLDLAARYGFERYDVSDFASQNVPLLNVASGTSNAIFLGDSTLDYKAHRIAVLATQRF